MAYYFIVYKYNNVVINFIMYDKCIMAMHVNRMPFWYIDIIYLLRICYKIISEYIITRKTEAIKQNCDRLVKTFANFILYMYTHKIGIRNF